MFRGIEVTPEIQAAWVEAGEPEDFIVGEVDGKSTVTPIGKMTSALEQIMKSCGQIDRSTLPRFTFNNGSWTRTN